MANRSFRTALILPVFLLIFSAFETEAAFETKEFTLSKKDTLYEDLYFGGYRLTLDGLLKGDVIAGAQRVLIRGRVADDVNAGAEKIEVEGIVEDDLRAFGRSVIVEGRVEGDMIAGAAEVEIADEAVVHGNLFFGAGKVIIRGEVEGSVRGRGGELIISGDVGRDVEVRISEELILSPTARIDGDLTYSSKRPASISNRNSVRGEVHFERARKEKKGLWFPSIFCVIWHIFSCLAALVVGFILLAIHQHHARSIVEAMRTDSLKCIGFGFAALILVPVLIFLFVLFLITIPLSGIVLLLFLVAFYLSKIYTGIFIGHAILRSLGHEGSSLYLSLFLGLVLLYVVMSFPFIGWLVYLLAVMYGLGGMIVGRQAIFQK